MSDFLIRNIPHELRRALAKAADASGVSLSDSVKRAILAGLNANSMQNENAPKSALAAIREARGDNLVADAEHEEFM